MRIAVAMGGPSSEHDISLESGRAVVEALSGRGHACEALVIGRDAGFRFQGRTESPLTALGRVIDWKADAVFIALHGHGGEDGHVQALLEWAGIPYTGSSMAASAATMDKARFKADLIDRGLPTPPHLTILRFDWLASRDRTLQAAIEGPGLPAMLKVASSGSSYGVERVTTSDEAVAALDRLFSQDETILWEACVEGEELTVPVFGNPGSTPSALPVIQIIPKKGDFFDLASKYDEGGAQEIVPAPIPERLARELTELACACHVLGGCSGLSRTDFMVGSNGPMILEINTVPGMTPASLVPKALEAVGAEPGLFFEELVRDCLGRPLLYRDTDHAAEA